MTPPEAMTLPLDLFDAVSRDLPLDEGRRRLGERSPRLSLRRFASASESIRSLPNSLRSFARIALRRSLPTTIVLKQVDHVIAVTAERRGGR